MAELYSQYLSGAQFTAGTIVGSSFGASGLNPISDRLNSIAESDNLLSGTNVLVYASGGNVSSIYTYEWFDTNPSFVGNTYTSADIFLNQNLSGCKVKSAYFASGTGSMVWELYKVSAGSVESLISGLPYNTQYVLDAAINAGSFPRIRLKINRSIPQNKLDYVSFNYR